MAKKIEIGDALHRMVGERIREARRAQRHEQAWLAAALGVSRTTMSNIEGGRQRVFLDQVYEVARHLHVDVTTLMPRLDDVTPVAAVRTPSDDPLLRGAGERLSRVVSDVLTLASAGPEPSERNPTPAMRRVQEAAAGNRRKSRSRTPPGDASVTSAKPGASRRQRR